MTSLAIVGDAFAKPMLRELDDEPGHYDISSVLGIISSGVMWSPEVKRGLLRHNPKMVLTDSFGASEAMGFGRSDTTADGTTEVAQVHAGAVLQGVHRRPARSRPGSGEVGFRRAFRCDSARLLQGRGEDREDLSGDRRRALFDAGRLIAASKRTAR